MALVSRVRDRCEPRDRRARVLRRPTMRRHKPRSADHARGQRLPAPAAQRSPRRHPLRRPHERFRSPPAPDPASAYLPVGAAIRRCHRLVLTPSEVLPDRVLERLPTCRADVPVDHRSARRCGAGGLCDLPSSSTGPDLGSSFGSTRLSHHPPWPEATCSNPPRHARKSHGDPIHKPRIPPRRAARARHIAGRVSRWARRRDAV